VPSKTRSTIWGWEVPGPLLPHSLWPWLFIYTYYFISETIITKKNNNDDEQFKTLLWKERKKSKRCFM
jgi:hypothetical protein